MIVFMLLLLALTFVFGKASAEVSEQFVNTIILDRNR